MVNPMMGLWVRAVIQELPGQRAEHPAIIRRGWAREPPQIVVGVVVAAPLRALGQLWVLAVLLVAAMAAAAAVARLLSAEPVVLAVLQE